MTDQVSIIIAAMLPGVIGGLVRGLVGMYKHIVRDGEQFDLFKLLFSLLLAAAVGGVAGVATNGDWRVALLAGFLQRYHPYGIQEVFEVFKVSV